MGQEYPKEFAYESGIRYMIVENKEAKTFDIEARDVINNKQRVMRSFKDPESAHAFADDLLNNEL